MKANFTGTSYNISIFNQKEKQITSSMFMQSLHCSGYHLLESTPLHELLTQQKHDHLPLLHFFFPFYIPLVSNCTAHVSIKHVHELHGKCFEHNVKNLESTI